MRIVVKKAVQARVEAPIRPKQPWPYAANNIGKRNSRLKENAFLSTTIKPIVDEAVAFKAPVPYALREVKRMMDKGIHFRDNTYGLAGAAGDPHPAAIHEYDDWAQWAQIPAGNIVERNEGLSNYLGTCGASRGTLTSRCLGLLTSVMMGARKKPLRSLTSTWRVSLSKANGSNGSNGFRP